MLSKNIDYLMRPPLFFWGENDGVDEAKNYIRALWLLGPYFSVFASVICDCFKALCHSHVQAACLFTHTVYCYKTN